MKRAFLAGAAFAALCSSALAADLPPIVKAPAYAMISNPCTVPTATTPLSCSGFYVGGGLRGQGSNADIIGSGINGSVFAGGITPSIDAGYLYAKGNWVFGAELDVGYAVNSNASTNGVGSSFGGWRITEDFLAGGNLAGLLGVQTPITIPPQLANSVLAPYVHTGATQWQFANSWAAANESGAGILFDVGPRIFGKFEYTYTNFNGAKAGNGLTIQNDQSLRMSIDYKLN